MTVDAGELAADRVWLRTVRRSLGLRLATYRTAAGVSQPELAQALGRTRSTISKVEHGTRGMALSTCWPIGVFGAVLVRMGWLWCRGQAAAGVSPVT
ncbi:MAG: helix-turn-helix domain-containing protein [Pseudonocardiaceae bacterium]